MTDLNKLFAALAGARQEILSKTFREPYGAVYLSVDDARAFDEESQRRGDYAPVSQIKVGDTGTIMGLPFVADNVPPGVVFIGHRVDVNTPTCSHCGQEIPR